MTKTYEEQLEEIAKKQKTLEAQKQKLMARHNEKEKKECVSRRLEIGKIVEEAIENKIVNLEKFELFVNNHKTEIKETQAANDSMTN